MALAAGEVARFSIRRLRQGFSVKEFRNLRALSTTIEGHHAVVELVAVPAPTARSGVRTYLRCPACGKLCLVVGFDIPGRRWGCRACLGWRSRKRPRIA